MEGREAGSTGGKAAAAYLVSELQKFPAIEPAGTSRWTQEFAPDYRNVLAFLPGSDSDLKHEIILVGAHYDHVGRGRPSNSYGPYGQIHNGADDNASGTAALLELIDRFTALEIKPRRSILFAFWDAEEIGLLGSTHWVRSPTREILNLRLAINIDMLGRLRDGQLTVMGWRSSAGLRPRLTALNPSGDLQYQFTNRVIADSDHFPFYQAKIPCLHFDTGKHDDYHRPTDDAERLNYHGLLRLSEMVYDLISAAANEQSLPAFRDRAPNEQPTDWLPKQQVESAPPRLGVKFAIRQKSESDAIVAEIVPASSAHRSGIRPGDRIVKFAHWNRGKLEDLRTIIQTSPKEVTAQVERVGEPSPIDVRVELGGEPIRVGISWQTDDAYPNSIVLNRVLPDSPADRAGMKVADIVTMLDGNPISSDQIFREQILKTAGPLLLTIDRDGRPMDISVNLFLPPLNGTTRDADSTGN